MEKLFKIFIDGSSGTTGLRIADRLAARPEFELLHISDADRKDVTARAAAINGADLAFLCLPDAAAKEVLPLLREDVRVLDTSTAHRTAPGWVYGLPELRGQRDKIVTARRVAVPGCHATGFITLAAPLVALGLAGADYPFTCTSLTGYSGGGKSMIAEYRVPAAERPAALESPRAYGLSLHHKHLPEMQAICRLAAPPVFCPVVADYYSGMETIVPLRTELLKCGPAQIAEGLAAYYGAYPGESQVTVHPLNALPEGGFMAANSLAGTDKLEIYVLASPDGSQVQLISLFDNLGKGSSGAAVQCMNLMLGLPENEGLE